MLRMNEIMNELAYSFPNDNMRFALQGLIGRDRSCRLERTKSGATMAAYAPPLTLDHVHLIKGAREDAPEPWRQIVEAVVSYVEMRDSRSLYEIERGLAKVSR